MKILKSTTSLALAIIMSVIFSITSFATDLCTVYVKGNVDNSKAFECLEIVNYERAKSGLAPLVMDNNLMQIAIDRAFEANLYFSHKRPDGSTTNYWENIASGYSLPQHVMDGWMTSSGHRDNILNPNQTAVGIACVNGTWCQIFDNKSVIAASKPANCTVVRGISCDVSNMYMESPYRYKPANLSVGDRIELLAPKLYLFNQLCYGVDTSSYDITTSDSSIATVNGLTLTAHNSGNFSVIYTLKGTNISTSVEFSVEGTVEEEKPEPKNISECTFTLSKTEYTYSGKECEPTVVIKDGNKTLAKETDYTVGYEDNIDAGCGKAYITGIGGYSGTKTLFFDIYMKNILDGAELEYYECVADGTQKKPKLITTTAVEGVDYTVTYINNVKPGIGIAYIEATNINYYGWGELYFNINEPSNDDSSQNSSGNNESESAKTNISDCIVTLSRTEYTYSGSENKPTPTVKYGSKTLVKGVDFNVRYENNIDAGCASAYITGIGRYEGTKTLLFDIYPKVINFDDVKLEYYECIANGTPKKPKIVFANVNLKEGIDYIASYKDNVKPGIGIAYYETINPNYVGWAELYFNINLPENEDTNQVTEDSSTAVTDETTDIPEAKKTQTISVTKNAKLTYGKTLELFASAKTAISYKSLDTSVAKINSKGIITAIGAGTTKILVTAAETGEYEGATSYVNVTVEKAVQKITVSEDSYTKYTDSPSFNLGAKAKTKLSYKSTNTNIATVSSNGTVTIKGSGTVSIKITAAESANYKSASKTVLINVYKNSDNDSNIDDSYTNESTNATAKDKLDAEVIIEPDSKTSQSISVPKTSYSKTSDSKPFYLNAKAKSKLAYKTSNSKIVTVNSNGKVTIKGIGKATITVTAVETSRYEKAVKKVTVTVKPSKPKIKDLSSKSNRITIRWDKLDDNITGYQIAYKRVGSESYKCKTYKGSSLTKKVLKGFSGGTYYVKMRTYKVVDGKRVYSSWSSVKLIKVNS